MDIVLVGKIWPDTKCFDQKTERNNGLQLTSHLQQGIQQQRERDRDRQTDRRQTDRQAGRQTDRKRETGRGRRGKKNNNQALTKAIERKTSDRGRSMRRRFQGQTERQRQR